MLLTYIFIAVGSLLVGGIVGFFVRALVLNAALKQKQESIDLARKEAEQLKRTRLLEVREEVIKYRSEAEREIRDNKREVFKHERRVSQRDENLTRKSKLIEERENNLVNKEKETRWSMNCRFKGIFTPYGDKKLGEFFEPISLKAASKFAMKYRLPKIK